MLFKVVFGQRGVDHKTEISNRDISNTIWRRMKTFRTYGIVMNKNTFHEKIGRSHSQNNLLLLKF